jgi:GST-like protein
MVKGKAAGGELRQAGGIDIEEQRKVLFGQAASVVR